ncbi:MAG: hypothetical protein ACKOWF_05490 [Chloroflexota bacterium]
MDVDVRTVNASAADVVPGERPGGCGGSFTPPLTRRAVLVAGLAAGAHAIAIAGETAASRHRRSSDRRHVAHARLRDGEVWPGRAFPTGYLPPQSGDWADGVEAAFSAAAAVPSPVVAGFDWYTGFDYPVLRQGAWWIGLGSNWGSLRARHAVVYRPPSLADVTGAWQLYDQGDTNGCVGFAVSRAAALFNRQLYAGDPLYRAALLIDEYPGARDTGTSVDAGLRVLRDSGAWLIRNGKPAGPLRAHGIKSFSRLATAEEIQAALGTRESFVRILSSWGAEYPREVRMPFSTVALLLNERSQIALPVDRLTGGI